MVAAYSNRDSSHQREIEKLITDQKIGGLIFFQGGPIRQANLTNAYQAKAKVPCTGFNRCRMGIGNALRQHSKVSEANDFRCYI